MPAATMFSKFKSGPATPQNPIDGNPISQHFEIGKQTACAGPELVWRIHDGYKKSDGRVSLVCCGNKVFNFCVVLRKNIFFVCVGFMIFPSPSLVQYNLGVKRGLCLVNTT